MSITVVLENTLEATEIPSEQQFTKWMCSAIAAAQADIPKNCEEMHITIVDKAEIANLNKTYRKKEGPTNVLAFEYDSIPGFEQESLGDLVICADVVTDEAKAQNKTAESHWAHLTIHGTLHLLGYDHITDEEANIMEPLEIKALEELGFENPYKETT